MSTTVKRILGLALAGGVATSTAFAQEPGSLQETAQKVLADLQKARQADDSGDVPFVFGHYPAPEAIAQTATPTTSTGGESGSSQPPAIVPPSWKGNGTVTMRGQIMVFVNGQSYKVGDTLEGYTFKDINANEITVSKGNQTFKRPAR